MTKPTLEQAMNLLREFTSKSTNRRMVTWHNAKDLLKAYDERDDAEPCMHGAIKHGFCDVCDEGEPPKAIEPLKKLLDYNSFNELHDSHKIDVLFEKVEDIIARLEVTR